MTSPEDGRPAQAPGHEGVGPEAGAHALRIVKAGRTDAHAVTDVERAAFGRDDEAHLVAALLEDPTARPCLSLLAFAAGRPVGHVLLTKAALAGAPRDVSAVILAPLAVRPECQRRGVGRALIERGADLLAASGTQLLFVLGDPSYYPRVGFVPAMPYGLRAPYPIIPQEAWMVRALVPGLLGRVTGVVACATSMDKPEYWRE